MLLQLKDGGILSINTDRDYSSGCETCDYGSSYVNEYDITMTKGRINVVVDQEYEYALSEGYMMELLLPNVKNIQGMTENQFYKWLKSRLEKDIAPNVDSLTVNFS